MHESQGPRDFFWIALIFSTTALVWLLWSRAYNPNWHGHLQIDPIVYQARAVSFLENNSWSNIGTNEYQPGALWFFAATACGLEDPRNFDSFLKGLFVANTILLCLHILLAAVFGEKHSPWLMLILSAATGPILLFRFELLVSFFVLTGWLLWKKGHLNSCGIFLGFAMATKVYPVLLAPILLVDAWRTGKAKKSASILCAVAFGLFGTVFSVAIFGSQSQELISSIRFHVDKPFGIDGLLGSIIPVLQKVLGIPLRMAPRNGIHGFDSDLGAPLTTALILISFIITLAVMVLVIFEQRKKIFPSSGGLFVLFGAFVGLGKLMAPQYTWWAVSLLPLVSACWLSKLQWAGLMGFLVSSLIIGQIVYPLNYSEFISIFSKDPLENSLFWINAVKNLLWIAAVAIAATGLYQNFKKLPSLKQF